MRSTLGIESDGLVEGCPSLPSAAWGGGTIRDHSLVEIWERASALHYTRDRTVEDLSGFCRTCYYADTCRAGCTWTVSLLVSFLPSCASTAPPDSVAPSATFAKPPSSTASW